MDTNEIQTVNTTQNSNVRRWMISTFHSFLAGFLIAVGMYLVQDHTVNAEALNAGFFLGLLSAGIRGGIKALSEKYFQVKI